MISRDYEKVWSVRGVKLRAEVSPCSFMYENYGLQLTVFMPENDNANQIYHIKDVAGRNITATEATVEDFNMICDSVRLAECVNDGCSNMQFVSANSNRDGLCEKCFHAKVDREYAEALGDQEKQQAELDKIAYEKGGRYRVDAWVHPATGGEDYQVFWYSKEKPTDAEVQKELKDEGSAVHDDFTIVELTGEDGQ